MACYILSLCRPGAGDARGGLDCRASHDGRRVRQDSDPDSRGPLVGQGDQKNTNAKVELANGVICDTLRAFANGRKDYWDLQLPLAEFAINNTDSVLGDSSSTA